MKPPRRKRVIYKPATDRHARTEPQRKIWRRYVETWFPDARDTVVDAYGFLVRLRHPNPNIKVYTIVWRYGGIPNSNAEVTALIDYLRGTGETMSRLHMSRYRQGLIHTMNA